MKPARVVSLADRKNREPRPEDIARLLRAAEEGRPVHELRDSGHAIIRRYVTLMCKLAGTVRIDEDLAASFEYAVAELPDRDGRDAKLYLAALWRCLHGKRLPEPYGPQKDTHKRVLRSAHYIEADIFADIFCGPTGRKDATPEVRELIALAFKELAALVGVDVPAFAWTARAWKKARAAWVETFRAARLLCEAAGQEDIPHHSSVEIDPYTHTGAVARVAAWLGYTLWDFHVADEYGGTPLRTAGGEDDMRLGELRSAVAWARRLERYGADAVRRAAECRARMEADAIEAARASVPDVDALLGETGTPDIDAALASELGDEWERFIREKGGAA